MSEGDLGADLAVGCAAEASSQKSAERGPANAVDGRADTRWTSTYADDQWLSVDLGQEHPLSHVAVRWEAAYAETYLVQAGTVEGAWETLASEHGRDGWVLTQLPAGCRAQRLRVLGQKRATQYGFSIWELRVFAVAGDGQPVAPSLAEDAAPEPLGAALQRLVWSEVWRSASGPGDNDEEPGELTFSDNLALGCHVEASSAKSADRAASNAVDGDATTRWTSVYADDQWLSIDMGEEHVLSYVAIRWEAAYAEAYRLEGSSDGAAWTALAAQRGRRGWVLTALPPGSAARWLRICCDRRATGFGFSIWEVRVHAEGEPASLERRAEECLGRAERAAAPRLADVVRRLREQAETAGRAASRALHEGRPRADGAAAPLEAPAGLGESVWLRVLEAVRIAATAATLLLLDLRGQESGLWPTCLDELSSNSPEHYAAGAALQREFEAKWASLADALDAARAGVAVNEEAEKTEAAIPTRLPLSEDGAQAMQGMRVAIVVSGSRGDFQPFLALALGMASRYPRMALKVFTDEGHCEGARQFGLSCLAIEPSAEEAFQTNKGLRAMTKGDVRIMFQEDIEDRLAWASGPQKDWGAILRNGIRSFRPTLILCNELKREFARWYSLTNDVPAILMVLQPQILPTNEVLPMSLARMEQDPDVPKLRYWLLCAQHSAKSLQEEEDVLRPTPESTFDQHFGVGEACVPCICAFSGSMWPPPKDWPQRNVEVVGYFKIGDAEQKRQALQGGGFFGEGRQRQCEAFLASGAAPVYVGWGSMIVQSSEHMTLLAVEALFLAKKRGVLLGGWANLSLDCLDRSAKGKELRAYCTKNVLFLSSAPHEWLFPRCSCAVHHGGVGTVHASLAAGVPTVVTPVWVDQFEIAAHVQALKVGLGTCQLASLTPQVLADAIATCCASSSFKANARRLGERMSKEDGVGRACDVVERFVVGDLRSGAWQARHAQAAARLREHRAAHARLSPHELLNALALRSDLHGKYPALLGYWVSLRNLLRELLELIREGQLWCVKAASCPALQDDFADAKVVGHYSQLSLLRALRTGEAGKRLLVRRRKGSGPLEAWACLRERGRELLERVQTPGRLVEVMRQRSDRLGDFVLFKDVPA